MKLSLKLRKEYPHGPFFQKVYLEFQTPLETKYFLLSCLNVIAAISKKLQPSYFLPELYNPVVNRKW